MFCCAWLAAVTRLSATATGSGLMRMRIALLGVLGHVLVHRSAAHAAMIHVAVAHMLLVHVLHLVVVHALHHAALLSLGLRGLRGDLFDRVVLGMMTVMFALLRPTAFRPREGPGRGRAGWCA